MPRFGRSEERWEAHRGQARAVGGPVALGAGGAGLKENGIFNNAYVCAKDTSEASREWIVEFNKSFTAYYEGTSPAGRTAQFVGGYMDEKYPCGISNRAMFTV